MDASESLHVDVPASGAGADERKEEEAEDLRDSVGQEGALDARTADDGAASGGYAGSEGEDDEEMREVDTRPAADRLAESLARLDRKKAHTIGHVTQVRLEADHEWRKQRGAKTGFGACKKKQLPAARPMRLLKCAGTTWGTTICQRSFTRKLCSRKRHAEPSSKAKTA